MYKLQSVNFERLKWQDAGDVAAPSASGKRALPPLRVRVTYMGEGVGWASRLQGRFHGTEGKLKRGSAIERQVPMVRITVQS